MAVAAALSGRTERQLRGNPLVIAEDARLLALALLLGLSGLLDLIAPASLSDLLGIAMLLDLLRLISPAGLRNLSALLGNAAAPR